MSEYRNLCIILAGGKGVRLGGSTPKQYIPVAGRTVIEYTLYAVKNWEQMDSLVIVADDEWIEYLDSVVKGVFEDSDVTFLGFAKPGTDRQGSILSAMEQYEAQMAAGSVVMIHDSVRPMLSEAIISECYSKTSEHDGVTPVLRVKETIYESIDGLTISSNLDRDHLYVGQTPEFFDFHKYLEANRVLSEEEFASIRGSAQPAVIAGMNVAIVDGDENNFKITTKADMERFRLIKESK